MSDTASKAWTALSAPWKVVFDQAWASWCEGNYGIGAALVDPATEEIVSTGRNRVEVSASADERAAGDRSISGTFLAHAEMNALATLPRFKADGLHLYTSLEPCLMCAGSAILMHVQHVHFASPDELFADLDVLWDQHPYSTRHKADRSGPLRSPLATFARVLPLTLSAANAPNKMVMIAARAEVPLVAALATELAADRTLEVLSSAGSTTLEAIEDLWPRLCAAT